MTKKWTNVAIADLAEMGAEYIHRAYLDPNERWNGWVCPWFEKDEVMRMASWIDEMFDEGIIYDEESDMFLITDGCYVSERIKGKDIDGMHLYPVGNGGWTWEETRDYMTWRDVRDRINLMEQNELDMPAFVWLTSETDDGSSISGDNLIGSIDKQMQDGPAGENNTISFVLYDYSSLGDEHDQLDRD